MSRSQQKSKANALGIKKRASKKNLSKGSISNWCDADEDAEADISNVDPHPKEGRHNNINVTHTKLVIVLWSRSQH